MYIRLNAKTTSTPVIPAKVPEMSRLMKLHFSAIAED